MLKILLITLILVGVAVAAMGIRMLIEKDGSFRGGSCLSARGMQGETIKDCACGGHCTRESES